MAHTSVKITADADAYKAQMKTAAEQMKVLSSEYNLAATKAKLFGTETDSLKAKAESLTQKINVQNSIVKMSREEQERLTKKLEDQKAGREKLKTQIDAAQKAYEAEKKATGASSDASKALKEELDKLKDQYKTNESAISKTEAALTKQTVKTNEAETSLIEMEAELKNVNEQLSKTNEQIESSKLDKFAESCQSVSEKAEDFGNKMMGVTDKIADIAEMSIETAAGFESGMSKVRAVSGATEEDMGKLTNKAREMGKNTKFSAEQAAGAFNYMAMAGWKTNDMLNSIEGVMHLAAASGEELATTSDILTDAMTAFHIKVDETTNGVANATHVADVMAAAMSNANTNVSLMGEGFKYCAPVAGALGFSLEETAEAIGLMSNSSVKGTMSGTAMRRVMTALAGDIELSGQKIGEMTIRTKDSNGKMRELNDILKECRYAFSQMSESEQAANAQALVGQHAMSGFLALINAAPEDIDKLRGSIENCDGRAEEMAKTMEDNLNGQITILKSAVQELEISVGNKLLPTAKNVINFAQKVVDKLNEMSDGKKTVIVAVGLMVAAIGPLAVGFGKVAWGISESIKAGKAFGSAVAGIVSKITAKTAATVADTVATTTATAVTGGMTAAQTALNLAMSLCPILLIVAAIAALIAAGVLLCKNWDQVKEETTGLWGHIKDKFNSIKESIKNAFSDAKEAAKEKFEGIKKVVESTPIGQAVSKVFKCVGDTISKLTGAATETVKKNLSNMKNAYEKNGGGINGIVAAGWEGIKGYYTSGFTFIDNLTDGKLSRIKDRFGSKMEGAYEKVKGVIKKIQDAFDFKWKLPELKLPHFKVTGKFSLSPPSAPKFSIQWYKTGAIMNSPMIFGMNNNTLLAGGEPETGGEAILPLAPFYTKLSNMLDKKLAAVQQTQNIYLESHTYIDGEEISNRTVSKVDAKMVQNRRKGR